MVEGSCFGVKLHVLRVDTRPMSTLSSIQRLPAHKLSEWKATEHFRGMTCILENIAEEDGWYHTLQLKYVRSWAPKVLMCQAIGELLSYWDKSKLSFDPFIPLYNKKTAWDFLILFTFFSFVPQSGTRISMLSICREKGLTHQDIWRPAP